MDSNHFDFLTRQLASGVSRRQVLKGLLSFAFGTLLTNVGFKSVANAYTGDTPLQDEPLFLPMLVKGCEIPSTCSKKQYCIDKPNCLCLETPEGDIRCGQIPSTCDVPLCTTSADCAHLGEGYFCDVPNSGCCTDPPATLSRCIAPCTPHCPPARVCGGSCCDVSESCIDGECISSSDCEYGSITLESTRNALAQLAAGATTVNLSPKGCIQLHQTVRNGIVVAKSLTIGGKKVSDWTRSSSQLVGQRDIDLDGVFEWQSTTTLGATEAEFRTIENEYALDTKKLARRTTISPKDALIHIVIEEANAQGTLQIVEDYLTSPVQEVTLPSALAHSSEQEEGNRYAASPHATCEANPCDVESIKARMDEGVNFALQCLSNFGDRGLAIYEAALNILSRNMTVRCAAIPGNTQANIGGWANPDGRLTVTVDPAKYCNLDEGQRAWLLFHEILHAALQRGHDPEIDALEQEHKKQLDRVYGCIALCYENAAKPTKCMCAQCFGTVTCDPICEAFSSDCGATCPCPARFGQYYSACSTCLAQCPSGLSCFGYSYCDPVGHSPICPPVTCPG